MPGAESSPFTTEPGFIATWNAFASALSAARIVPEPPPHDGPPPAEASALAAKVSRAAVTVLIY